MKSFALFIAGCIFGLVSIAHLVRYFTHTDIIVSGYAIPMNVSLYGFVITLLLAIWMFVASRR